MDPFVKPNEASLVTPDTSSRLPERDRNADRKSRLASVWPYVQIARPDHWFKNVFMVLGVVLAWFYQLNQGERVVQWNMVDVLLGFAAVCLIASSNYVINEILDASTDRNHPVKRNRPIPSGNVNLLVAYMEWIVLGVVGLAIAAAINKAFLGIAVLLWLMGLAYNVPPVRTKDIPYIDVLSESVNNPLRLLLGWFAVTLIAIPPVSLIISYWMVGAFFMATKRFAEYRSLVETENTGKEIAGAYRSSFRYYDESRLLISMFFYATASALFLGIFIIRYHIELILSMPLVAGFFSYYMHVALKKESPAQSPERLYRERGLMLYLLFCVMVFMVLMFVNIPIMDQLFNIAGPEVPSLWEFY